MLQLQDSQKDMQQRRVGSTTQGGASTGPYLVAVVRRAPILPSNPLPRLTLSPSERKIDQFEARLAGIESMLRELTLTITNSRNPSTSASATDYSESPRPTRAPSHATPSSHHSTANTAATPATNIHNDDEAIENDLDAFEGDSSMAAQTAFASEFLHKAVGRTSFCVPNPDMESALQALQQMVAGRQRDGGSLESRFEHVLPIPPGGFRELPKPPTELIVNLLRVLKGSCPYKGASCAVLGN